jgi:hypothetical protein
MQRMRGEQRGDAGAAPDGAGHAAQQREQEQRVERVQRDAHPMVRPCIETEALHVEHVRQPSQRMPVRRVRRFESPRDGVRAQAFEHVRVGVDVGAVVEAHEAVVADA